MADQDAGYLYTPEEALEWSDGWVALGVTDEGFKRTVTVDESGLVVVTTVESYRPDLDPPSRSDASVSEPPKDLDRIGEPNG